MQTADYTIFKNLLQETLSERTKCSFEGASCVSERIDQKLSPC